jgi:hypothetical protein
MCIHTGSKASCAISARTLDVYTLPVAQSCVHARLQTNANQHMNISTRMYSCTTALKKTQGLTVYRRVLLNHVVVVGIAFLSRVMYILWNCMRECTHIKIPNTDVNTSTPRGDTSAVVRGGDSGAREDVRARRMSGACLNLVLATSSRI